jgi:hypothetical protein
MGLIESAIFTAMSGVRQGRGLLSKYCILTRLFLGSAVFLGLLIGCTSAPEATSSQPVEPVEPVGSVEQVEQVEPAESNQWGRLRYPSVEAAVANASGFAIQAPKKTWTWVPFADSMCADGSPSGIMVNLNPESDKVMIHMQGGGVCWDWESCHRTDPPDAINLNGFDRNNTDSHFPIGFTLETGVHNRRLISNPFRDWNMVVVPYCTGDLHSGRTYSPITGMHHVGRTNLEKFLQRLVPTFADASQVLLTGSSAGGYGAIMNFEMVHQAFAGIQVDVMNDSGPQFSKNIFALEKQEQLFAVWGLADVFLDCTACLPGHMDQIYSYLAKTYPDNRFGLVTTTGDDVIRKAVGKDISPKQFADGLSELHHQHIAPYNNVHIYAVESYAHVLTLWDFKDLSVDGVSLMQWAGQLVSGAPQWADVYGVSENPQVPFP